MSTVFSHRSLERIQDLIYSRSLLSFSPSRMLKLENGLRERLRARAVPSLEDYCRILETCRHEFDHLIERVTTGRRVFSGIRRNAGSFSRTSCPTWRSASLRSCSGG